MDVHLEDITKLNWEKCVSLKVRDDQSSFVASNAYSLAQSKFEDEMYPLGIYDGEEMVGFAMYIKDSESDKLWLVRFMIDMRFQRKGYGRKALGMLVERFREEYPDADIYLCVEPENNVAISLYERAGFSFTGEKWDNEDIYKLQV